MDNQKVFVAFILDESGSMQAWKPQTIDGFNEYLGTLANSDDAASIRFSLTKFNMIKTEIVCTATPVDKVEKLDSESYQPSSLTPLYDAIGATIQSVNRELSGDDQKVMIVIQTDGEENCSKKFDRNSIFSLIEKKKKLGWTFVFLGADQDAYAASADIGIARANTMSYKSADTRAAYENLAQATVAYTSAGGKQTSSLFDEDKKK